MPLTTLPLPYRPNPFLAAVSDDTAGHAIRLVFLIRSLFDYGKRLCHTLRENAARADFATFTASLGGGTLSDLIARITAAMSHAAMLQVVVEQKNRIGARFAAASARIAAGGSSHGGSPPVSGPRDDTAPSSLAQLLAAIRRRPIDAVLADICRDLGIGPDHALWQELYRALVRYGAATTTMDHERREHRRAMLAAAAPAQAGTRAAPAADVAPTAEHIAAAAAVAAARAGTLAAASADVAAPTAEYVIAPAAENIAVAAASAQAGALAAHAGENLAAPVVEDGAAYPAENLAPPAPQRVAAPTAEDLAEPTAEHVAPAAASAQIAREPLRPDPHPQRPNLSDAAAEPDKPAQPAAPDATGPPERKRSAA